MSDVKSFFETLYSIYNKREYVVTDPIKYVYELSGNKEFIAFTAACFAYGNVKAIQKFLSQYFEYAGTNPLELNCEVNNQLYYRFQKADDIAEYSRLMKAIYNNHGSLEQFFVDCGVTSIYDCDKAIRKIHELSTKTHGIKFLMPIPKQSASKRLYMFLRWMIRKDNIDLGLWDIIDKSELYMPADTHILRMATNLGIISENSKGKKAVDEVTKYFRELNNDDPAKYDFALSRLGIAFSCQYSYTVMCNTCNYYTSCVFCAEKH